MPLKLMKNATSGTVIGRGILGEGLYDTEVVKASTSTSTVRFYSNPLNSADASGQITAKNYGETNLQQSSQIPKGQKFQVHGYTVKFLANTSGTPMVRVDADKMILGSWVEFKISEILISRKVLQSVPFGAGQVITSTNTNTTPFVTGESLVSNRINLKMGNYNPTIESGESFSFTLNWNTAVSLSADIRVLVELHGLLIRPV